MKERTKGINRSKHKQFTKISHMICKEKRVAQAGLEPTTYGTHQREMQRFVKSCHTFCKIKPHFYKNHVTFYGLCGKCQDTESRRFLANAPRFGERTGFSRQKARIAHLTYDAFKHISTHFKRVQRI